MRVRPDEVFENSKGNHTTRAQRANAAAVARQKARHVERDYFGRPILSAQEQREIAAGAQMLKARAGSRLDAVMVERGLAPSRDKAKALIAQGVVFVGKTCAKKASMTVPEGARVRIVEDDAAGGSAPTVSADDSAGPSAEDGSQA